MKSQSQFRTPRAASPRSEKRSSSPRSSSPRTRRVEKLHGLKEKVQRALAEQKQLLPTTPINTESQDMQQINENNNFLVQSVKSKFESTSAGKPQAFAQMDVVTKENRGKTSPKVLNSAVFGDKNNSVSQASQSQKKNNNQQQQNFSKQKSFESPANPKNPPPPFYHQQNSSKQLNESSSSISSLSSNSPSSYQSPSPPKLTRTNLPTKQSSNSKQPPLSQQQQQQQFSPSIDASSMVNSPPIIIGVDKAEMASRRAAFESPRVDPNKRGSGGGGHVLDGERSGGGQNNIDRLSKWTTVSSAMENGKLKNLKNNNNNNQQQQKPVLPIHEKTQISQNDNYINNQNQNNQNNKKHQQNIEKKKNPSLPTSFVNETTKDNQHMKQTSSSNHKNELPLSPPRSSRKQSGSSSPSKNRKSGLISSKGFPRQDELPQSNEQTTKTKQQQQQSKSKVLPTRGTTQPSEEIPATWYSAPPPPPPPPPPASQQEEEILLVSPPSSGGKSSGGQSGGPTTQGDVNFRSPTRKDFTANQVRVRNKAVDNVEDDIEDDNFIKDGILNHSNSLVRDHVDKQNRNHKNTRSTTTSNDHGTGGANAAEVAAVSVAVVAEYNRRLEMSESNRKEAEQISADLAIRLEDALAREDELVRRLQKHPVTPTRNPSNAAQSQPSPDSKSQYADLLEGYKAAAAAAREDADAARHDAENSRLDAKRKYEASLRQESIVAGKIEELNREIIDLKNMNNQLSNENKDLELLHSETQINNNQSQVNEKIIIELNEAKRQIELLERTCDTLNEKYIIEQRKHSELLYTTSEKIERINNEKATVDARARTLEVKLSEMTKQCEILVDEKDIAVSTAQRHSPAKMESEVRNAVMNARHEAQSQNQVVLSELEKLRLEAEKEAEHAHELLAQESAALKATRNELDSLLLESTKTSRVNSELLAKLKRLEEDAEYSDQRADEAEERFRNLQATLGSGGGSSSSKSGGGNELFVNDEKPKQRESRWGSAINSMANKVTRSKSVSEKRVDNHWIVKSQSNSNNNIKDNVLSPEIQPPSKLIQRSQSSNPASSVWNDSSNTSLEIQLQDSNHNNNNNNNNNGSSTTNMRHIHTHNNNNNNDDDVQTLSVGESVKKSKKQKKKKKEKDKKKSLQIEGNELINGLKNDIKDQNINQEDPDDDDKKMEKIEEVNRKIEKDSKKKSEKNSEKSPSPKETVSPKKDLSLNGQGNQTPRRKRGTTSTDVAVEQHSPISLVNDEGVASTHSTTSTTINNDINNNHNKPNLSEKNGGQNKKGNVNGGGGGGGDLVSYLQQTGSILALAEMLDDTERRHHDPSSTHQLSDGHGSDLQLGLTDDVTEEDMRLLQEAAKANEKNKKNKKKIKKHHG